MLQSIQLGGKYLVTVTVLGGEYHHGFLVEVDAGGVGETLTVRVGVPRENSLFGEAGGKT